MKITQVRAVQPTSPGAPNDWRDWLGQILVMIDTDEGLTGYGVGGGGLAGVHVVETVIRDILLGQESSCLLYTSPSPRDRQKSRMPSSA